MPLLKKSLETSFWEQAAKRKSLHQGGRLFQNIRDLRAGFQAQNLLYSFSFAMQGVAYAFRTQRNFRIHVGMATTTIFLAAALHLSVVEWTLICGLIGVVLFAELTNTAIELLVDLITEGDFDLRAKAIKDMAAGAVLITAMAALACGLCIFTPHLLLIFNPPPL